MMTLVHSTGASGTAGGRCGPLGSEVVASELLITHFSLEGQGASCGVRLSSEEHLARALTTSPLPHPWDPPMGKEYVCVSIPVLMLTFPPPGNPFKILPHPENDGALNSFSKFAPRGHQGLRSLERRIKAVSWDQQGAVWL